MADSKCATCGGPLEAGYVSTTNGSGLEWAHEARTSRLRPKEMEVLVPTGFSGMYSANLPGDRCPHCKTILLHLDRK